MNRTRYWLMLVLALTAMLCSGCFWFTTPTFTVTYDANGADGGAVPVDPTAYEQGEEVTVLGNSGNLVMAGHTFAGWNDTTNGIGTDHVAGSTFTMPAGDVVLYAVWDLNATFTVTYDANGADAGSVPVDSNEYEEGDSVTVLGNSGNLEMANFVSWGWNTNADGGGTSYAQGDTFDIGSQDVTLYANWTEFHDDFTRTDTTGRDLGVDWEVKGAGSDEMRIDANQVYSTFVSSSMDSVSASYDGPVDYSDALGISVKFKVAASADWPIEIAGLIASMDVETWQGYFLQVNYSVGAGHQLFLSEFDGLVTVDPVTSLFFSLSFDTWYLLELVSDGTNLTGRIKDETGASTLGSVSLTDSPRTYDTGKLGFYNFTVDSGYNALGYPVYFDEFKLEVMN